MYVLFNLSSLQVRYTVMEKISRIPISTLTDVNQVSTMIAAAAEVKEQVNSTAQVQIYNSLCAFWFCNLLTDH